jgi:hypothetical protein
MQSWTAPQLPGPRGASLNCWSIPSISQTLWPEVMLVLSGQLLLKKFRSAVTAIRIPRMVPATSAAQGSM